ncbi:MAG: acyl-CoA dehydrogenase family protein [Acidimicrobiia bacterium]|nr:acyl-CoA dehydrogenase family protein [Acidimicrobiia bacterium]
MTRASSADRVAVDASTSSTDAVAAVRAWIDANVPAAWRAAARRGGEAEIRSVRSRDEYEQWYPVFGRSGLAVATWPVEYGGLGVDPETARLLDRELAPFKLGRLNPLGLNLCAPALFAHGTDEQRLRFLPPIVTNDERWCQLFSEPGSGSDLASLATRAERDGDDWTITGQKIWTTWAHHSDWAVLLARTDPTVPKRKGITYFLLHLHPPGVDVRPLRHITGEVDFNEVFLDGAMVPDAQRVGSVDDGWRVAGATLSSERQMVAGAGSGGVDRIGGSGIEHAIGLAQQREVHNDPVTRQRLARMHIEERIRLITNRRVRAGLSAGRAPGPESSVGKVHSGDVNQRLQVLTSDLLGADAMAWPIAASAPIDDSGRHDDPDSYGESLPREVHGMLRSRANTIEGGTSEVNKNIVAERVLGLPREPDPWRGTPWNEVPRS